MLSSCDEVISVKDYSFVFSGKHHASGNDHYITLTLEEGCPLQKYTISYAIDEDPSLILKDDFGAEIRQGSTHDFGSAPKSWRLPLLRIGEHKVVFSISGENYSQTLSVPFTVSSEPFALHAEVRSDLSAGTSTLLLSLAEGISDKDYSGFIYVDGALVDPKGFRVNFHDIPILSVVMPLLRPGSHKLLVEISDELTMEVVSFLFDEPLRYPDIQVEVARSSSTGKTRFMVRSNPYGLSVYVKDSLAVKGRCDYHVAHSWWEGHVEEKTSYKELCDVVELQRFVPKTGVWYDLTDTAAREMLITNQYENNTGWETRWNNGGEGFEEYFVVPDGVSHYKIESSTHFMTVQFEALLGASVHVSNSEKTVVWNKVPIGESYTYKLTSSVPSM